MMSGLSPPSTRSTSSAFVLSPQSNRCSPNSQSWPVWVFHLACNSAAMSILRLGVRSVPFSLHQATPRGSAHRSLSGLGRSCPRAP